MKIEDNTIIESYNKHKKITLVIKETGVSYVKIKRVLQENNLFEQKFNIIRERKFNLNDRYFELIDTPEKAYWLGFLWGDGYISKSQNIVGISLSINDIEHLEKFKKAISFDGNINIYEVKSGYTLGVKYCRLTFTSKDMIKDLKSIGFLENKSLIMKPPKMEIMNKELHIHFLRGLLDANGSICPANNIKKDKYYLHVLGTIPMIDYFKHIFNIINHSKLYQRKEDCPVYDLRFSISKNNRYILDDIYYNSNENIRLNRKYDVYKECIKNVF